MESISCHLRFDDISYEGFGLADGSFGRVHHTEQHIVEFTKANHQARGQCQ